MAVPRQLRCKKLRTVHSATHMAQQNGQFKSIVQVLRPSGGIAGSLSFEAL